MNLVKSLIATSIITLLISACSESSKPQPAELTSYKQTANIERIWRTSAGKGVADSNLKLQPSIYGNTLYAADLNGDISAFNINNGKRQWRYHYQKSFSSNLASTDTAVYVGTNDAELIKINAITGEELWTIQLPSAVLAAPLISGDMIYVKTIDGQLTAIRDGKNSPVWNYQQSNPPLILRDTSNLNQSNHYIAAGFPNGYLALLDNHTGSPIWERQITIPEGNTDVERMVDIDATPIIENHVIYTATYQGEIVAVRETTGDINWRHESSIFNNIVLDGDTIYATDEDSFIWAFDKNTGEALWHQDVFKNRGLTAPATLEHFLIVGDKEGYLHILNTEDGRLMARIKVNSSGISSAPMVKDKKVFVLSNGGELYAYRVDNKK